MKADGEVRVEGRYFINRLGRVEASSSWRAPVGGRSPGQIRNPVPLGFTGVRVAPWCLKLTAVNSDLPWSDLTGTP